LLDYQKWENGEEVIKRAAIACTKSGQDVICTL